MKVAKMYTAMGFGTFNLPLNKLLTGSTYCVTGSSWFSPVILNPLPLQNQ